MNDWCFPDCKFSPAQIIYGRPLRDNLTLVTKLEKYSNPNVLPTWRQAWKAEEEALCSRITHTTESLQAHSHSLRPLALGEAVFIQNQQGNHPTKWDRSGIVVESLGNDQYRVKVDGSGRLTLRNHRFLRAYTPVTTAIKYQPVNEPRTSSVVIPQTPPHPLADTSSSGDTQVPTHDLVNENENDDSTLPTRDGYDEFQHRVQAPVNPVPQLTSPPKRPSRERRPPKYYDAETGKWIER